MRTAVKEADEAGVTPLSTRFFAGSAALLAHQGGWDEILLVAGPIVVIVGGIAVVKRRLERSLAAKAAADETVSDISTNSSDHPES